MLVLKINYTKHLDRAQKSVRYHAFRTREVPKDHQGMFNRDSDHAHVATFIESLDDPLTRPRQTRNGEIRYPVMHRLMYSLSRKEFEDCGLTSWKPVIREAIASFERYHGIRLEWIAAEHQSRDHPHVHLDIKSVYGDVATGERRRLRITQDMRVELRQAVDLIIRRERERVRRDRQELRAMQRGIARFVDNVSHSLLQGLNRAAHGEGEPDPLRPRRKRRRPEERERKDDDRER